MNPPPLVINTRPGNAGEKLHEALLAHGHRTVHQPAINIEFFYKPANADLPALLNALTNSDNKFIFVSRNAVIALAQILDSLAESELGPYELAGKKIYAVGPSTAEQLQLSFQIPFNDINVPKKTDVNGLIEEYPFYSKAEICVFKGLRGRETLYEYGQQNGAHIQEFQLYDRIPVDMSVPCLQWPTGSILIASSIEIAMAIISSADRANKNINDWRWVVFSDRIRQHLIDEKVEIKQIYVCEQMDNSSIIKTIETNIQQ